MRCFFSHWIFSLLLDEVHARVLHKTLFPPLPLLFIQSLCTVGPVGQNQSDIGQLKQEKSCVGRLGGSISRSQFSFVCFFPPEVFSSIYKFLSI